MGAERPMTPEWLQEIIDDLKSDMPILEVRKKHKIGYKRLRKIQSEYNLWRHRGSKRRIVDPEAQFYDQWCRDWDIARKRILGAK